MLAECKAFHAFLLPLFRKDWVVHAKRPFGGPEHVLHYLARYTHRVAISNHRIVNFVDGKVTFRWKDYAHASKHRPMTVTYEESGGSAHTFASSRLRVSVGGLSCRSGAIEPAEHLGNFLRRFRRTAGCRWMEAEACSRFVCCR